MTEIKRPDCPVCGGQGWYEITVSAHDPNCDGSCSNCPVPERGQEQCQICSYFDDAEAALAAKDKEIEGPRSQITENAIKELKAERDKAVKRAEKAEAIIKEYGDATDAAILARLDDDGLAEHLSWKLIEDLECDVTDAAARAIIEAYRKRVKGD